MKKIPIKPMQLSGRLDKKDSEYKDDNAKLAIDYDGNIIDELHHEHHDVREHGEGKIENGEAKSEPDRDLEHKEETSKLTKDDVIYTDFSELKRELEKRVGFNISFDVVFREMVFGGQKTGIFYYNGFAKDTVLTEILKRLSVAVDTEESARKDLSVSPIKHTVHGGEGQDTVQLFMDALVPHIQVKETNKLSEVIDTVSTGATAFFFEGSTSALLVDAKTFPTRSTAEPDLERVVRGARDGFVETLLTNVTLVRRRIRDPRLKLEMLRAGRRTHTDICLAYIDDICDPTLVESIRDKIKQVKVDGLPLAEKQLEEAICGKGWNPYPMVRYSERPDVVSVHLLEGHVAIFVDTSPSVIILPTTFFHHVQHAEEYRQTPMVGTYLRWVRFIGIAASLFLLPLWFLLVTSPELKPAGLEFIGPQKQANLPLLLQFLIAEVGTDLMRMAAVHTPSPLATAMGLVAAILVGDVAVKTGLFVNEVILYLAVAAVGTFATPSYEMSLANRLTRMILLIATAAFKVPGFVIVSSVWLIYLTAKRSYNAPYMWPFIPFNGKALTEILLRRPFLTAKTRMSLTKTSDSTRNPKA
ncbi:spore germination protein [Paenibacillus radicis (ex Xue et al. 2023)]|uniref:Spore germination protein n=1 Tax=Paenibacillus radicis (ex Xue et al. 2023) TaxID=2972489 RepID=A0ABT1YV88_9BACL|nr:spore germination protein [Paenibacillus radicis (ex Xue et al. 2023)]MCR8636867.1 spore germination protein [Paenibacillus radicis (ex Xue et al. 2023)]